MKMSFFLIFWSSGIRKLENRSVSKLLLWLGSRQLYKTNGGICLKKLKINVDYVDCVIKYVMITRIKELAHNKI